MGIQAANAITPAVEIQQCGQRELARRNIRRIKSCVDLVSVAAGDANRTNARHCHRWGIQRQRGGVVLATGLRDWHLVQRLRAVGDAQPLPIRERLQDQGQGASFRVSQV